jgi:Transglycosylase SLT domain
MNALHTSVFLACASMALALGCASDPAGSSEGVLPPDPTGTVPTATDGDAGAPPTTRDATAPKADATTPPKPPADRGFLDPNRPSHSVFSGVAWSVNNQTVAVTSPPAGSVATVTTCMRTYGASIVKYADLYRVSRASVVATESNCTNPAGSSDGLSSGPMQVTGGTCAGTVSGYSSAACLAKMHSSPDFSFMVGAKYMGSSYQVAQHDHDPPKIAAAYNAGSIRSSTANRWHMVVTGNHIERWVGAYNAYRAWEKLQETARIVDAVASAAPSTFFDSENVATESQLPVSAREGQVYFVGDWAGRDGEFRTFRGDTWLAE